MIGGIIGSVASNVIGGALSGKKSEEGQNPIMKLLDPLGLMGGGKKEEENPIAKLMEMANPMSMLGGGGGGGLSLLG